MPAVPATDENPSGHFSECGESANSVAHFWDLISPKGNTGLQVQNKITDTQILVMAEASFILIETASIKIPQIFGIAKIWVVIFNLHLRILSILYGIIDVGQ